MRGWDGWLIGWLLYWFIGGLQNDGFCRVFIGFHWGLCSSKKMVLNGVVGFLWSFAGF